MTLTRRGKLVLAAGAALAVAAGAFGLLSRDAPAAIRRAIQAVTEPEEPPACPLTGLPVAGGQVPDRPALAVKVENLPEARPQAGLLEADIVYEEPVEGGITRFIAVFHCRDSGRVGPVRSARTTDPDVLVQFGRPLLGYAGGAPAVRRVVARSPVVDLSYLEATGAYERDPNRSAPHNLYTATRRLYRAGRSDQGAPEPIFTYDPELALKSRRARRVHLPFSGTADVVWIWRRAEGRWLRSHGDVPHTVEGGERVGAVNLVVQVVKVVPGDIIDAAGNPSPEVRLVGRGRAYVLRNGRVIVGRWIREDLDEFTRFVTKTGDEIPLSPGTTWVELLPSTVEVTIGR